MTRKSLGLGCLLPDSAFESNKEYAARMDRMFHQARVRCHCPDCCRKLAGEVSK